MLDRLEPRDHGVRALRRRASGGPSARVRGFTRRRGRIRVRHSPSTISSPAEKRDTWRRATLHRAHGSGIHYVPAAIASRPPHRPRSGMPDTLPPRTPPRDRAATSAAVRLAAIGAPLLTAGVTLAAAWAGVSQRVQLPDWWGPWPWRTGSSRDGYVVAGIVLLGMLCVLWTWLAAAVLSHRESPPTRGVAAVAAACAVPLALGGSVGSLDVQSYAAIGRLAAIGLDPYRATTGWLGDRYSAAVDPLWRWTPTPYGPLRVALLRRLAEPAGDQVGTAVLLIRPVAVLALVAAVVLPARAAGCSGRV